MKNTNKINAFFILFSLLFVLAFTTSPNPAVQTDEISKRNVSSLQQSNLTFNVTSSETVVYTLNNVTFNGYNYMNLTNEDPNTHNAYDIKSGIRTAFS